ncbi:hypothetical protein RT723_06480 [Psychrosphaera aquimarina]|uniref:SAM-dependent MTase RsmB/NOP-type domain-containing protein n=1 Tax=Psychrosphaera aquimarina TaxID=2044854 RepID=A0ABU3QZ14_9GAMM|nr:hypothetical protein [Psychrosphaera aquimarina]MDU0112654.1 hypothetical protein [Psychrosphaera aquimarina]
MRHVHRLGTIRRHPDVVWTKDLDDITYLAGVQKGLLDHAISLIKPGGVVVFSNCSLEPDEGEDMILRYIEENLGKVELVPADRENRQGFETAITQEGFVAHAHPTFV